MKTMTRRQTWKEDPVTGVLVPPAQIRDFLSWWVSFDRNVHHGVAQWADANGLERATVQGWFRDPRFIAAFNEACDGLNLRVDRTQRVIDAMWARAVNGDTKAAELYLRYVGKLIPTPTQVQVQVRQVKDLSEAELMAELERVRKALPSGEVIDAKVVERS